MAGKTAVTGAIPAIGGAVGAGATSLGIYNALGETLGQMAEEDKPLAEVEIGDVWREGIIGVKPLGTPPV